MNEFTSYCLQRNELSVEYLSEKFALPQDQIITELCKMWHKFDNPRVVNDMIVTNYARKDWYWETCDTKYRRGEYVKENILQYHWLSNMKQDQHISVYGHDQHWVDNVEDTGSVSGGGKQLYCPILWVELDRKDYRKRPSFSKAVEDAQTLRNRILCKVPQAQVWVFSSGNNSTHVAINGGLFGSPVVDNKYSSVFARLAHELTNGLRFGIKGNPRYMSKDQLIETLAKAYPEMVLTDNPTSENEFKWDAQTAESALENCDQSIYHTNALIRQPWSYHEKGGYQKSLINFNGSFDNTPRKLDIKDQRPHLLGLYLKAWNNKPNKNYTKKLDNYYDSSYIIEQYSDVFEGIEHMKPNSKGWIEDLYNPFYNDTCPSASVNINTGRLKDFGSERFTMDFETFLIKKQEL